MMIGNFVNRVFSTEARADAITGKLLSKMKEEHVCSPPPDPKPWYKNVAMWVSIFFGTCAVVGQIVALIVFFAKMDAKITEQQKTLDRHETTIVQVAKVETDVSSIKTDMVWVKSFLMSTKKK